MEIKKPLLIAEDEPVMRRCIKEVLSVLDGYDLYEAADGVEALEQIERLSPDLVVLDLLMPRMDGFEVLTELKKRRNPKGTRLRPWYSRLSSSPAWSSSFSRKAPTVC